MSSISSFVRSHLDFFVYSILGPQLSVMAHKLWKDTDLGWKPASSLSSLWPCVSFLIFLSDIFLSKMGLLPVLQGWRMDK